LVLYGWGSPAILQGFLVAITFFVVMVTLTVMSFKSSMK